MPGRPSKMFWGCKTGHWSVGVSLTLELCLYVELASYSKPTGSKAVISCCRSTGNCYCWHCSYEWMDDPCMICLHDTILEWHRNDSARRLLAHTCVLVLIHYLHMCLPILHFPISETQCPSIKECYVAEKSRSIDPNVVNFWNVRSG